MGQNQKPDFDAAVKRMDEIAEVTKIRHPSFWS